MADTTLPEPVGSETSTGDVEELVNIADSLVRRVGDARRQLEELRQVLDGAAAPQLADIPQTPGDDAPTEPESMEERLRLDALNMALIGATRDEARAQLLELFSQAPVTDVEAALDVAYGSGDGGDGGRRRRFARLRR